MDVQEEVLLVVEKRMEIPEDVDRSVLVAVVQVQVGANFPLCHLRPAETR